MNKKINDANKGDNSKARQYIKLNLPKRIPIFALCPQRKYSANWSWLYKLHYRSGDRTNRPKVNMCENQEFVWRCRDIFSRYASICRAIWRHFSRYLRKIGFFNYDFSRMDADRIWRRIWGGSACCDSSRRQWEFSEWLHPIVVRSGHTSEYGFTASILSFLFLTHLLFGFARMYLMKSVQNVIGWTFHFEFRMDFHGAVFTDYTYTIEYALY